MLSSAREGFQQPHIVDKVSIIFSSLADCNMLGASLL
jgi:hypothetical protein